MNASSQAPPAGTTDKRPADREGPSKIALERFLIALAIRRLKRRRKS